MVEAREGSDLGETTHFNDDAARAVGETFVRVGAAASADAKTRDGAADGGGDTEFGEGRDDCDGESRFGNANYAIATEAPVLVGGGTREGGVDEVRRRELGVRGRELFAT